MCVNYFNFHSVSVGFTVATITVSETMTDVQLKFSVVEGTPRRYTMFDVTAGMNSTATVGM